MGLVEEYHAETALADTAADGQRQTIVEQLLMEDIPYRLSTAAQNVGYNQPSEPGFYLGPDETVNPFLK